MHYIVYITRLNVCEHNTLSRGEFSRHMVYVDPYSPTRSYYECCNCGYREVTDSLEACPKCQGRTRNIAVARE